MPRDLSRILESPSSEAAKRQPKGLANLHDNADSVAVGSHGGVGSLSVGGRHFDCLGFEA